MYVKHEVQVVWSERTDGATCSYSRYEDEELAARVVWELEASDRLPSAARAFRWAMSPDLFHSDEIDTYRVSSGGETAPGSHSGSPSSHLAAALHYQALANEARDALAAEPFPEA